jgi:hydrogenase nickel incorporation protein HypA/HybF
MHEFSLVDDLLRQVEALRQANAAERVVAIHVSIGELAGVEPDLFRSAFACLAPAANLGAATLQLKEVALEAACRTCAARFRVARFHFVCPHCGAQDLTVIQGEAVVLDSLVLEKETTASAQSETQERALAQGSP